MNKIPRGDWRNLARATVPVFVLFLWHDLARGKFPYATVFTFLLLTLVVLFLWGFEGERGKGRRIILLVLCGILAVIFNGFVGFALYSLFNPGVGADASTLLVILFLLALTAPIALFLDLEFVALWKTGHTRLWHRWFRR